MTTACPRGSRTAEVIGFASLIGSAGTETLTKLLANAVVLFQRHPDEWKKVVDDPSKMPGAVEETLRYWPPSQYQGRVLTDDVTAHGVEMAKGSRVLLLTAAANRDEREYPDADKFDVDRNSHVALGFGYGLHFCLGAALARLEGRIGLEEFARRFPALRDRRNKGPSSAHEQRPRLRERAVPRWFRDFLPASDRLAHRAAAHLGHSVLLAALLGWNDVVKAQSSESYFLAFLVALHVGTAIVLFVYFWRAGWRSSETCCAASFSAASSPPPRARPCGPSPSTAW